MRGRVRQRRDKIWYDTAMIVPGRCYRMFGSTNVGDYFRSNLAVGHQLTFDNTYVMFAIGVRCLGRTREQEDLLLDHVRVEVVLGDMPQIDFLGSMASILRHVFTEKEAKHLAQKFDDANKYCANGLEEHRYRTFEIAPSEGPYRETPRVGRRCERCDHLDDGKPFVLPPMRVGYHFIRPMIVPVRQHFAVRVNAAQDLPESVHLRVYTFGLESTDWQAL